MLYAITVNILLATTRYIFSLRATIKCLFPLTSSVIRVAVVAVRFKLVSRPMVVTEAKRAMTSVVSYCCSRPLVVGGVGGVFHRSTTGWGSTTLCAL